MNDEKDLLPDTEQGHTDKGLEASYRGCFFTSIGMAGKSIFLSLTRQVLFLIPLALIMPLLFEPEPIMGVWWSIPVSDTISALVAAVMIWVQVKGFREG